MRKLSYADALKKAREFDIEPVVSRYMQKRRVTDQHALAVADEMLKYLSICATQQDIACTITGEVDDMWHTFIIFTERYATFCNNSFGRFINHRPSEERRLVPPPGGREPTAAERYAETIARYHQLEGDWPDARIWPRALLYGMGGYVPQPCDPGGDGPICEPPKPEPGTKPPWYP